MSELPLLQSHLPDTSYRFHRPSTKKDYTPIPLRWHTVLALHLAGGTPKEVCALTGYSLSMYYRILNDPVTQTVRQQLLNQTQQEFEALFARVVDNIREELRSEDPQVRLAAQQQWLRANGRYAPKGDNEGEALTAEDVVKKLLQVNVQVNVDTKQP